MTDEIFTEPDDAPQNWVDVRMTNPDEGEWEVDFVVVDGQVDYVDLRIRPGLLAAFVECLIEDINEEEASRLLIEMAERQDLDLGTRTDDE